MLRKLFGLPPVRLPRPARTETRAPAARAEAVPCRRKPVLEALESRLLLSADPLGALDGAGVLALQLGDGDDQALVERIGESAAGGDIVAVTFGAVTQQYGDAFFGIVRLLIDAGAGDDWIRIVGVTVTTDIIGGLGTDTFEWQHGDATWSITARDTGEVETVTFSSFEHLVGGDDNRDTFLFAAGAVVSGGVDGGAGGFDSMVIQGGEYQNVTYTANASGADTVALDDHVIAFDGIEAGTLGATTANLTLNATADDDTARLRDEAAPGQMLLDSVTGTFADLTFVSPTASLTINLGAGDDRITIETFDHGFSAALGVRDGEGRDRIDFAGTVATHGHDLSAAAETIVVAPGSVLRTDLGADGAVGDLVLAAAAASTDALGAADAAVTVGDGTLIGRNITISATATFTVNAAFIDGSSTATVAILGGSDVAAAGTLAIDVHSFVSAATDAAQGDVAVASTAAARIGGAATLEAGGDLAVDVANVVDVTAAGGPVAVADIAIETIVLVDFGATLAAQDVSLHATSDASFALAGVVAVAESESATGAGMGSEVAIDLGRRTSLAIADSNARAVAGTLVGEALRPDFDRDPARPVDQGGSAAPGSDDDGVAADLYRVATGRPLPEASSPATELDHAGPGELLKGAIARDLAAVGAFGALAELQFSETPDADSASASALAASAGSIALLPVTDADVDARGRRRSGVESEPDGDDGDTGLGASLALSMIKDSALAELARNITTGGGVVLTASGMPFTRGRARSAAGSAESESGGTLEIRDADATGTVILAEVDESSGNAAAEGGNVVADDRDALHFVGAGELVLATAARHDLIAEASGGAERGTAVTAATPIDVTSAEATAGFDATDTFTLAVLPDAAAAHGAAPEGVDLHDASADGFAGLALSTHLPALEFEVRVDGADHDRPQDAIRSGDDVNALVGVRAIAVSALLDPAVLAPAAASGRASGHDVGELVRCLDDAAAGADATRPARSPPAPKSRSATAGRS